MEIDIIKFIPDRKGMKLGLVDFRVTYNQDKYEIFRSVGYFEKDNKKWLSVGNVERDGKWVPRYERKPSVSHILSQALEALDLDIKSKSAFAENNSAFDVQGGNLL